MLYDRLAQDLYTEVCRIPLVDAYTHIDPRRPTGRGLHDLLGYHAFTELAHATGVDRAELVPGADPRSLVRAVLYHAQYFDNSAQYQWFIEIARAFLGFEGERVTLADATWLCDQADRLMSRPDWEPRILRQSNLEKVFFTSNFDDPLDGFDADRYLPCPNLGDVVFRLEHAEVRQRLAKRTGVEVGDFASLSDALARLFEHFTRRGAKACAISLPPNFAPEPYREVEVNDCMAALWGKGNPGMNEATARVFFSSALFWLLAEHCRRFDLPVILRVGIARGVYPGGVPCGQDLFDPHTSLLQCAALFNAFPQVHFCVTVPSSTQNEELVAYARIFPNVNTFGHWWHANVPVYVETDLRARLQTVAKTQQIGYSSDAYTLEFALPKYNLYRRILAQVLADDFVRSRIYTEPQAVQFARLLLRDNARRIFNV